MNTKIKLKLKELREFQKIYPESHCGGSIGLMLHGIDLQRDLGNSDLDITTPDEIQVNNEVYQERSDGNDFDYCLKRDIPSTGYYVKFDIRVCPEPSFEVVEFEGYKYNVSRLKDLGNSDLDITTPDVKFKSTMKFILKKGAMETILITA
jgi:hypothetical protein